MATLGGYGAIDGSASQSGNDVGGRDIIDVSNPITTAGTVESFSVWMNAAQTAGHQLKLKIWRLNGSDYDFIGESQAFELLASELNTGLTLSSAITGVQVGDYVGIWLSPSANNKVDLDADTGSYVKYKLGDNNTSQTSASFATFTNYSLCVEVYGTTGGADTTPDAFSFTDQTDVALSTLTTSNTLTITGIDAATAISVTGGEMSINSGAFGSASTTVVASDTVQLRVTSSASNSTAVAVTLDIGGVTDEWSVTTLAAVSGGTITTGPFKNNTGTLQTGLTGLRVVVLNPTDGTTVLNSTGNTTHATTAVLTLSDAALTPATTYGVITLNTAGTVIGAELITAT
jgi:hypothetical protein